MTRFVQDEVALTTHFKTNFEAAYPNIPVDYPGVPVKPTGGNIVRFRITRAPSQTVAIGGARRRNYGSVLVQIVAPTGNGPGGVLGVADAVSGFFRLWRSNGLKCGEPSLGPVREDGAFLTATVDIPFRSD